MKKNSVIFIIFLSMLFINKCIFAQDITKEQVNTLVNKQVKAIMDLNIDGVMDTIAKDAIIVSVSESKERTISWGQYERELGYYFIKCKELRYVYNLDEIEYNGRRVKINGKIFQETKFFDNNIVKTQANETAVIELRDGRPQYTYIKTIVDTVEVIKGLEQTREEAISNLNTMQNRVKQRMEVLKQRIIRESSNQSSSVSQ
ncbi:MAG: hypothetical protein PHG31_05755 [Candidatus Omnitrophica bacterium]|nr:hypothetical protein [Candidatus Omnitrophota bacterium]